MAAFEAVYGGGVRSLKADENPLIGGLARQLTQNPGQVLRTELAGSTGAVAELRQALVHDGVNLATGGGQGRDFWPVGRTEG